MFHIFRKPKLSKGIMTRKFQCDREGLTIRGTEYRPEGENLPIAIVCHEFMMWSGTVRRYAGMLAQMGYAAYCFDFCGGSVMRGKSDGKTTDMTVLTEVKDLEAVIEYVLTLPYVNKEKIFLMGGSQGGFVSALVAAKNKYPIEKLCLFYPAFCLPDYMREGNAIVKKFDPKNIPDIYPLGPMKLGRRYADDIMEMDAYAETKGYTGRVCIIHGTRDRIVDVSYAHRAVDAYKSTTPEHLDENQRVQLHIIEGGRHMFGRKYDKIATEKLKAFAEIN